MPVMVADVEPGLLDPRSTWVEGAACHKQARKLVQMFIANFRKFGEGAGATVLNASPQIAVAGE